ncbi:isoaspartyl peptidase/L-asparaginase-like [Hylaeus anthracinus]|uniref:isoaspartyl peptidase/L-asparaginase-like n=1 Tax=Hylaeus anthracinus TaxID=313031 RepID=UPI0023B9581C|nr:isoaspartyl peptidase/L-asparaginase-like [Hylaeus anthracinus]
MMCDYCSWIDQILARISTEVKSEKKKPRVHVDPVIVVHGGAGKIPRKKRDRMLFEVKNAAVEAYSDLINGRSAVHAVERAISYMESKPYFNCAKGGSLDVNDEVVTDAGLVTINDAGFVGAVRDIEHPIALARKVLENTEHILIVENGAQKFALDNGIPILPPGTLNEYESVSSHYLGEEGFEYCTDRKSLTNVRDCNENEQTKECDSDCVLIRSDDGEEANPYCALSIDSDDLLNEPTGLQVSAVGVVAYDRKRRLASGTSTAGDLGKPIGSVSAIGTVLGCGVYADEHGCVSVSGNDKNIYSYAPARKIIERLPRDASIDYSVSAELENFEAETGESDIGAIALNAKGEPYVSFKCMHFPWAFCRQGYVYYGAAQNEKYWEKVTILERPLDCMCNTSDED